MNRIHFGRIEGLHVQNGEPIYSPPPSTTRTIKMSGQNSPRLQGAAGDFELKAQIVELFEHLTQLDSGVVGRIEVAHGLPLLMEILETA